MAGVLGLFLLQSSSCVSPMVVRWLARSLAHLFPCPRFLFACPLAWSPLASLALPLRVCLCVGVHIMCIVHKLVLVFVRVRERLHSIFRVCVHLRVHAFCLVCSSCTRPRLCLASERLLLARSLTFFIVRYSSLRVRACSPLASLSRLLRVCLCVCVHIMCMCGCDVSTDTRFDVEHAVCRVRVRLRPQRQTDMKEPCDHAPTYQDHT